VLEDCRVGAARRARFVGAVRRNISIYKFEFDEHEYPPIWRKFCLSKLLLLNEEADLLLLPRIFATMIRSRSAAATIMLHGLMRAGTESIAIGPAVIASKRRAVDDNTVHVEWITN
jgi:hypothetical protein